MKRQTRDKFASGTQADITSGNACWETPPHVFAALDAEFNFDIDLTADAGRKLKPLHFGPGSPYGEDALKADWHMHGRVGYSNPPYGPFVGRMLERAAWSQYFGFTTVLLLPMRVTRAFRRFVLAHASELRFCDKRIAFCENGAPRINPKTGKPDGALFDSIVVVFAPLHVGSPLVSEWHVPDAPAAPEKAA